VEEMFLQTLLENPADRDARLVFADWLEEHSDPLCHDLRRDEGILCLWADGTLFWRLERDQRIWLLGKLPAPLVLCVRCGRGEGRRLWYGQGWYHEGCL
jgi:uncharacterized protein (TIGR02996 family)